MLQMMMMTSLSLEKFKIKVENPDIFCRSQWDKPGKLPLALFVFIVVTGVSSSWFIVYKVLVSLLFISAAFTHIALHLQRFGWKWFVFLTNQGLSLIILHHILHLSAVLRSDQPVIFSLNLFVIKLNDLIGIASQRYLKTLFFSRKNSKLPFYINSFSLNDFSKERSW